MLILFLWQSPIVAILSQSQLMAFLADHLALFEDDPTVPLSATSYGKRRTMFALRETDVALQAFELMQAMSVSAIPVLDAEGRLINSISASNVRLLTVENVGWLLLPIGEWLTKMNVSQSKYLF